MSSGYCKVLLCLFAVTWILLLQSTNSSRNDRRCRDLLRGLLRNPPNNTKIAINIGLSKARYICQEGFKLIGKEVRTCKGGKWIENVENKCLQPCGKPEGIPHTKVAGSSFNFNDRLRYECIKGYTLTGPRWRTCGDDGKWSEAPRCEEIFQCGQSLVTPRARIVGGTISQRGMWPWQVAIYRINKNVPQFSCGGVLVSRRWVLTAAHCFYPRLLFIGNANLYLIKAGDHNLSVNESLQQEIVPEEIFVHPRFKPSGVPFFDGDIALIKLSQEVELSKFVRTVCLPEKSEGDLAIPKTRGTVAGWGVTRPLRRGEFTQLSEISKVLRHASFPIQSDQLCTNKSGIQFNTTTAFCAGNGRGGEDACQGDSGGAFVRDVSFGLSDSKWVVIGVVSWGNGCAQKDQYGYYTRIHPFLDWIKETMNEEKEPANNKPTNQCSSETSRKQTRQGISLSEDCGLNLVFLFDASVSVDKFYFQTSLAFARELLTIIGASKRSSRTRVAAVTEAKLEFNLGDSKVDTIDKAIKAIDNIMYVGWVSSYIRPFKLVRNKVAPNSRNDSHQVLMYITDGLDLSGSARREAKYIRDNKHFEVYAIGIGRKVKTRTLMSIASANEDHNHVVSVRTHRNLQEAVRRVVHMDIVLASCQSPGGITHGKKFGSDYSHNKTVRYECDAEYTLEGKNKLTCNEGKWNYNPPRCKAPCSNPGSPAKGAMQGSNFRHNSWVTFSCDRHHQRKGKERIKCNDGSWSGSVPVCIAVCPDPGIPSQGMRVGDNFQDGETVTFECKKNYDLLGNATIRCNGGVWNSKRPKCKGRCDYSGNPNNGYTTKGNFRRGELLPHGSKVEYACDVSYTLTGSKILHCDNGTWNGSLPSCKASCADPGTMAQGRKIGTDYSHGQIVTYECTTQGYSLIGNPTLTCNDGSWDTHRPQCKVRSQCGADLTTESGVITSPRFPSSYPDEANCEWKIAVGDGSRITLTFVMFEVEGSNECRYDHLEVSNGQTRDSANQVAKLCGTELPKPITSSGPHLFLKFRSDSSMAFKGFKLKFTKTALNNCGATLSTLSGEIKSPNYPQPYQPNRNCIWKISVPTGNHIQLSFKEISIEDGDTGKCVYDYVQVYSGIGQEAEILGRYCGNQNSIKLASTAHTMTVKFHSDKTFNSKGFKAIFTAVCGAQLQASNTKRQFVSHPSYGDDNYEPNLHCIWQLKAQSDYKIHLRLKEFDVEMEKKCVYDYVIVRSGNNSTAPVLGRVCGKGTPVEFVSPGDRMWIEFRTDLTTNKKGFIAEYWSSFKTDK